jgi:hypothetical protein
MKFKHHGDVLIQPYKGEALGSAVAHNGSVILALGETTGHKHVITVPKIDDMEARKLADGSWLLTLKSEGTLTHEEHGTLKVAPGRYRFGGEREFDWFQKATRKVID